MNWCQTFPLAVVFCDYGILPGSAKEKTSIWSSETSVLIREFHETREKKTHPHTPPEALFKIKKD